MAKVLTPNATRTALEDRQRRSPVDLTPGSMVLVREGTMDLLCVVLDCGTNLFGDVWVDVRPKKIRVFLDQCCSPTSRRAKSKLEILAEKDPPKFKPKWQLHATKPPA